MSELYAVGWRVRGRPRQWVWSVFPSLRLAVRVARGYAACDGGGRWRVHDTRLDRERSTRDRQADVCQACGLVRLTSYRTGQVVRYVGADDGDA